MSLAAKDRNSKDLALFNQRSETSETREHEDGQKAHTAKAQDGDAVESFLRDCASIFDSFRLEASPSARKPASAGVARNVDDAFDDKRREILRCDCVQCEELVVAKLLFVDNSYSSAAVDKSKSFRLDDDDDIVDLDLDETFKDFTAESTLKTEKNAEGAPTERYTLSRLQCTCVKLRDTDGTLPLSASNVTVPLWHHRNAMVAAVKQCSHVREVVDTACKITGEQPQASCKQVPEKLHWRWVFGTSSNGNGQSHDSVGATNEPGT